MLGCSSAGVGLGATGSSIAGELLDEAVLVPVEGITHCEDASPAGGPNVEELPDPSSLLLRRRSGCPSDRGRPDLLTSPTNAALISRHKGTAAGRQTTYQAVALGRNPAYGHRKRLGIV